MALISKIIDFILNIDHYLSVILSIFGYWTYVILFLIIFVETGLVIMPFLPGDSLLFSIGVLAAQGYLNIIAILVLLIVAAILGDSVNYWIGSHVGKRLLSNKKIIEPHYLKKTKAFYAKYGKKTIILSRFVPIVRTFAPFVAGIGKMEYSVFLLYNVIGGITWVGLFTLGGYFFGNIPIVQEHFSWVIIGIILISVVPVVFELIKHKLEKTKVKK